MIIVIIGAIIGIIASVINYYDQRDTRKNRDPWNEWLGIDD